MSKKTLEVYWSPNFLRALDEENWNMLYPEPTSLFSELMRDKAPERGVASYLSCPSVGGRVLKNIFVFRNPIESQYMYDFTDPNAQIFTPVSNTFISFEQERPRSILQGPTITFHLQYNLFAEEPVMMSFTPPYFHRPKSMMYGAVTPGKMDIGRWYRPLNVEMQLWENKGIVKFEENEPLFYIEIDTDKEVILKRFKCTSELNAISKHCIAYTHWMGRSVPLEKRYEKFVKAKTDKLVLQEIRKNLVE